jgi:hypothetical protein
MATWVNPEWWKQVIFCHRGWVPEKCIEGWPQNAGLVTHEGWGLVVGVMASLCREGPQHVAPGCAQHTP